MVIRVFTDYTDRVLAAFTGFKESVKGMGIMSMRTQTAS